MSAILLLYIKHIEMIINVKYRDCADAERRLTPHPPQECVQF
jgi:hypothetical protein